MLSYFIRYYCISSYSFRGNCSFLNLEIQKSLYIRRKVTVHTCAETMWGNTVCFFLDPCHLWFCHYSFLLLSWYRLGCCQKTGTYEFYDKKSVTFSPFSWVFVCSFKQLWLFFTIEANFGDYKDSWHRYFANFSN